jgi:hypothetical protein
LGSLSGRVRFTPIEGLNIYASAINRYQNDRIHAFNSIPATGLARVDLDDITKSNSAVNAGFDYKPCALPRLHIFAEWTHNWNVGWVDDSRLDYVSGGFAYGLTEQLKFALQGDYLWGKGDGEKVRAWAIYPAIRYTLPYGANFELGYRYERAKNRDVGDKATLSTIYGQIGFDF